MTGLTGPLNAVERRVLGVLIEKALAQPQYYPMTTNAVVVACNQKSNRDPEMNLDEEAVYDALERLRVAGLVSRLLPGAGSRVERYRHEVKEALGWEKPQRAVMAELLLRGPQTVGELRGRCGRMYPFENIESVQAVLDSLAGGERPWVATLPRNPGQSAIRFAHRLYAEEEWRQLAGDLGAAPVAPPLNPSQPASTAAGMPGKTASVEPDDARDLRAEVAALRRSLSEIRAELDSLRAMFESRSE